jgi:AbrB family looped-hinge helix DNA binding protein
MISTIIVSSKGQMVIPENVRKEMGIEKGTKLVLIERGGEIVMRKEEDFIADLDDIQERRSLQKIGERTFKKLWDNKEDEVWDQMV